MQICAGKQHFTGGTTNMSDSLGFDPRRLGKQQSRGAFKRESAILTWRRHRSAMRRGRSALANRPQVTHDALDTATLTISKAISDNQDADPATAISQLSLQQVAVQAASQTFSKILIPR